MTLLCARPSSHADEWEFQLAPLFLWGISIDGEATIGTKVAPLDLNFIDDVLENLDTVYTVHFEAHKNKLTLFAEYQYVSLDPSAFRGYRYMDFDYDDGSGASQYAYDAVQQGP